jgi:hypothetical protein
VAVRTRLTLIIEVEHGTDYDPTSHFVYYFDDATPEPRYCVVAEDWEDT